ncbi:MAG: sulfatase-like hydrolase/transferase [Pirellula sp.]
MNKWNWALSLLTIGLCGSIYGYAFERPNIIVVVADDLGYADLGFQGCTDIPTPHLDALARAGVVCTNGYVTHPFCSPTRAGLLTGRYQHRFGHENNPAWTPDDANVGLPLSEVTIANLMQSAGYSTGAVGKWHLGAHPSFHPNRRGFEFYFGALGGGHQYFDHNQFQTNPAKAKQEYFIPLNRNGTPVAEREYLTDAFAREATAFVDANRSKPFFLYWTFNAPHTPLQAPDKYLARVQSIPDDKLRTYAAMICGVDDAIGAMRAKLKEHNLLDNTLLFFFSDNGGPTGVTNCRNTPLRGAKGQLYEGGIRVPFVISWPAKLQPRRVDFPVSSVDVLPTVLAAADSSSLADKLALDGIDLLSRLDKETLGADTRQLFWRTSNGWLAVRSNQFKWVKAPQGDAELYDLSSDVSESKDLAKQHPQVVTDLKAQFDAWNKSMIEPKWEQPNAARSKPN